MTNPIFKPKTKDVHKSPASDRFTKKKNSTSSFQKLIVVLIVIIVIIHVMFICGIGRRTEFDGHTYIHMGPYNTVHDPDCPCHNK